MCDYTEHAPCSSKHITDLQDRPIYGKLRSFSYVQAPTRQTHATWRQVCSHWRSLSWDNITSQCVLSAWTGHNSHHPFKHSRDTGEAATPPRCLSLQPESIYHQTDGFSINKDCCPCTRCKGITCVFAPLRFVSSWHFHIHTAFKQTICSQYLLHQPWH